jgi:hypothetical protein
MDDMVICRIFHRTVEENKTNEEINECEQLPPNNAVQLIPINTFMCN